MSSRRVLVGWAAERALPSSLVPRRNHGSALASAVMLPQPSRLLSKGISHSQTALSFLRPFHTTPLNAQSQSQQQPSPPPQPQPRHHRQPRPFHLAPPQPPSIHPHSSSTTPPSVPLPEQFRTVMRLLTHPVVVCTATDPATATPRAMTMSSFTSLALRPTPVVSFNIAVPSRTFDAVAASRAFNIHVLADDASGALVADWFAGGNAEGREVFERLVQAGGLEGVSLVAEAPFLEGDGVLYVLRCRLLDDVPGKGLVRVRDHVIVVGEVLEIVEGVGAEREQEERFGLLYADRRYRQLGDCITPGERKEGESIEGERNGS